MVNESEKIRKFGFILALILAFIGFLNFKKDNLNVAICLTATSGLVLIISLISYRLILPIYIFLTTIAKTIGWINTRILLSLIFYGIFTPVSLVSKLLRKDLLDRKIYKTKDTYWEVMVKVKFNRSDYEKQF